MNWLLKIIEGPMKGAEVALVSGTTVKFGNGETCDIVIADASMPAVVGELEVTDGGVSLIRGGGEPEPLPAFEIRDFGTTALAVGPADGAWKDVVRKAPAAEAPASPAAEAPASEPVADESEAEPVARKSRGGLGCLAALLLIVLLAVLVWYFWPQVKAHCPQAETVRANVCQKASSWYASVRAEIRSGTDGKPAEAEARPAQPDLTLAELAARHHLAFVSEPQPALSGNFARRTERLAVRALALAIDPGVRLNLTDDETLKSAAGELLFAATDGAISVKSAKDRRLVLAGYAPTPEALTRALRALDADVRGIEALDTAEIRLGGTPPPQVAKTEFATIPEEALPKPPENSKTSPRKEYLIAGILTEPYPCVVMRNGQRLVEGAQIGTASLVKIAADRLTLKDGGETFEWRP